MLVDMQGREITESPDYFCINVCIPADKYSEKQVSSIAEDINEFLSACKILHTEPEITEIYEQNSIDQGFTG